MTNTFLAHVMQAVGGPHRAERIAHPAVLATQCPACATAFRRLSIAVAHLCRAPQASRCTADRSAHELAAELAAPVCCICHARVGRAQTVTRFAGYKRHIVHDGLPMGTQERQVRQCWSTPKPEAYSSRAAPGAGLPKEERSTRTSGAPWIYGGEMEQS